MLRDEEQRRFRAELTAQENNLEMDIKDLNDSHVAQSVTNLSIEGDHHRVSSSLDK